MTITIQDGELSSYLHPGTLPALKVLTGSLWLTQTGCQEDRVLVTGDILYPCHQGSLILQALNGTASYEILTSREKLAAPERRANNCA